MIYKYCVKLLLNITLVTAAALSSADAFADSQEVGD